MWPTGTAILAAAAYPANATRPFRPNSAIDFDIVWLDLADDPKDDAATLQEVKTTSGPSLGYADNLIDDYDKLFGTNPRLTLWTRLQDIKNKLEFERSRAFAGGCRHWPGDRRARRRGFA